MPGRCDPSAVMLLLVCRRCAATYDAAALGRAQLKRIREAWLDFRPVTIAGEAGRA